MLLTPTYSSASDMNTFIGSLLSKVTNVMNKEATPDAIIFTDREIKLYLSNLHQVQDFLLCQN